MLLFTWAYAESTSLKTWARAASLALAASIDINLSAQFFALVAIEDAQRNANAGAHGLNRVGIVVRRVIGVPAGKGWIGRSVGFGKLVVRLRLLNRLHRCLKIRTGGKRSLAKFVERFQISRKIESAGKVELLHRRSVIE